MFSVMKTTRFASFLLAGLAVFALASCNKEKEVDAPQVQPTENSAGKHSAEIPGEAKVYLSEEMTAIVEEAAAMGGVVTKSSALNDLVSSLGITSMRRLFPDAGEFEERTRREGLHRWYMITFDEEIPVTKAGEQLLSLPGVEIFSPSRRIRPCAKTPNDKYWSYMWPLYSSNGINVQEVWEKYTTGNPDVIVCVVDGGIDLNHEDLAWNCLSEGHYNYIDRNKTITGHDHGSHVAGTIAAVSNNNKGVTGIAGGDYAAGKHGISLLSHQVFKTQGNSDVGGGFETAIKEGADHGALISQNSWGYSFDYNDDGYITGNELNDAKSSFENPDPAFVSAVNYFIKYAGCDNKGVQLPGSLMKGGVVIFAAGNDNILYGPPANYEPCIAVGATDNRGSRCSFSDYGDWVDICAPGDDIASTIPSNQYALFGGTSMACPHVSGVAALLISHFGGPGYTNDQLKEALLGGARQIPASTGSKPIGPLLDAMGAFKMGDSVDPVKVEDYTASVSGNSVIVTLTTNGSYFYNVYASTNRSLIANLNPENPATGVFSAVKSVSNPDVLSGEELKVQLAGLSFQTTYYITVVGSNYAKRYAEAGPIKQVTTATNNPPVLGGNAKIGTFHQFENISIPMEIYEPDGNEMEVTYTNSPNIGRGKLVKVGDQWMFELNCQLSQPGTFKMNVTATDEYGLVTRKEYSYEVLQNVAPVVSTPFDDCQLAAKGEKIVIGIPEHFTDADGEPLSYMVTVMNESIVSASLDENNQLTIQALANGMTELRVAATDALMERADAVIRVLVRKPTEDFSIYPESTVLGPSLTVLPSTAEAATNIRLITSAGSVVYQYNGTLSAFNPLTIDTSAISPGVYILVVTHDGITHKKTLIKK